jgi:hypothetical protein
MNEGCQGGWPIFGGFFAEQFYLPLESCAPYEASTARKKCSDFSSCRKALNVEKSSYIGKFYGGSSELDMMKELRSRGPIVADLEVPKSFSYYTSGIFSDDHSKALDAMKASNSLEEGEINENSINDLNIQW